MSSLFIIKRDDTHRRLALELSNVETTGASTVRFRMRPVTGGALKIDRDGTIETASRVSFGWVGNDLDTLGDYYLEVALTYLDGPETVPSNGYITVRVVEHLS